MYHSGVDSGEIITLQRKEWKYPHGPQLIGPLADLLDPLFYDHDQGAPNITNLSHQLHQVALNSLKPNLFPTLRAVQKVINQSWPELATDCWLCLK